MSILDESGPQAATVEHEPTVDWDDFHRQLHGHTSTSRRAVRCHWVRDPEGHGMICVWAPDTPTSAEAP